jgi:acyl-CoA thioester hydrolase
LNNLWHWQVRVYYEDTDAGGIVFYANYLKYFERARTEWLRHLGINQQQLREELGVIFVVKEVQVSYNRPARLDDVVQLGVKLVQLKRASLSLEQSAFLRPDEAAGSPPQAAALAEGKVRLACLDALTLKPQGLPRALLSRLGGEITS